MERNKTLCIKLATEILGVAVNSTYEEMKAKAHAKLLASHPDKHSSVDDQLTTTSSGTFRHTLAAYNYLREFKYSKCEQKKETVNEIAAIFKERATNTSTSSSSSSGGTSDFQRHGGQDENERNERKREFEGSYRTQPVTPTFCRYHTSRFSNTVFTVVECSFEELYNGTSINVVAYNQTQRHAATYSRTISLKIPKGSLPGEILYCDGCWFKVADKRGQAFRRVGCQSELECDYFFSLHEWIQMINGLRKLQVHLKTVSGIDVTFEIHNKLTDLIESKRYTLQSFGMPVCMGSNVNGNLVILFHTK